MSDAFNPFSGQLEPGVGSGVEIPADATISPLGEAIIAALAPADVRLLIGVVIGSDVQPFSAILTDIAGVTQAANKGIYFDSATTAATFDLTAVGRTLLAQTTQALMRTAGLGATTIGEGYFTLANPGAITFPRQNANNTVTSRTAAQLRTDLDLEPGVDYQPFSQVLTDIAVNSTFVGLDWGFGGNLDITSSLFVGNELQVAGASTFAGITVTAINGIQLAGTFGATYTFPNGTSDLVGLNSAQTLTSKTLTSPIITSPASTGGTLQAITTFGLRSTGAAFDLRLASTEVLTANRTLTVTLGNANRALTIGGDVQLDGSLTVSGGSLTFTLTGATNVELPTNGTLATLAGGETLENKTVIGALLQNTVGSPAVSFQSDDLSNPVITEKVFQNRVGTNNATPAVVITIPIPASTTTGIKAWVVARRTGGGSGTSEDGAFYEISVTYKNVGGTATIIGSATITAIGESQAGWDVTLNPSGASVQILGTGAANNDVVWAATAHLFQVSI